MGVNATNCGPAKANPENTSRANGRTSAANWIFRLRDQAVVRGVFSIRSPNIDDSQPRRKTQPCRHIHLAGPCTLTDNSTVDAIFEPDGRNTHWLFDQLVWRFFRGAINDWRQKPLGLAPPSFLGPRQQFGAQHPLTLGGFSSQVAAPPDWPTQAQPGPLPALATPCSRFAARSPSATRCRAHPPRPWAKSRLPRPGCHAPVRLPPAPLPPDWRWHRTHGRPPAGS